MTVDPESEHQRFLITLSPILPLLQHQLGALDCLSLADQDLLTIEGAPNARAFDHESGQVVLGSILSFNTQIL